MNDKQRRVLQSFRRVQDYLDAHPVNGNPSGIARHRAALDDAVQRIERSAVGQYSASSNRSSGSRRAEQLRQMIRIRHLKPIVHMARALAPEHPELGSITKLPPFAADSMSLVAAASSIADAAAPHAALFVENGLPPDFLEQLRAVTAELRDGMDDQGDSARRRAGATAAIQEAIFRGRQAVQLLGTIIEREAVGSQELLAEWRSASRVTPRMGRSADVTSQSNVMPISDAHLADHPSSATQS